MNAKVRIRLLVLFTTLFVLFSCSDSKPILIGFSGQLTGKVSEMGVFGRNGATLAIEVINASGGIDGRPLQLIAKDDLNTPQGAIDADRELIDAGVVAIIGHMTSSQSIAIQKLMSETGTVYVSPTSSTPTLSDIKDSFFRVMVENTIQASELAEYTRSALDIDTIVILADLDNKSYSKTFTKYFTKTFGQNGGKVLKEIAYSSRNTNDWDEIIDSLIELKPGALLIISPAQDAASLVQRIRTAGLSTKIVSGAWAYTDKLLQWGGPSVEGMIFAINYASDNPNPAFVKFKETYKNRFGIEPNFAAAFGYEAILALAQGLRKTHGSSTGLAEAMAPSEPITGISSDFELNQYGDVDRSMFIVTIQEGEFRTIEMR